jgi:hypothetical protein
MFKRFFVVIVACSLGTSQLQAQPVLVNAPTPGSQTITFNALPAQTPISNQFAALGVNVLSSCLLTDPGFSDLFNGDPMQVTNLDPNGLDCAGGTSYASATFVFDRQISYFGLLGIADNQILLMEVNGVVSRFVMPNSGTATFIGFEDTRFFDRVTVMADQSGAFALDDVSYFFVTPEPSSFLFLLIGVIGVLTSAPLVNRSGRRVPSPSQS